VKFKLEPTRNPAFARDIIPYRL